MRIHWKRNGVGEFEISALLAVVHAISERGGPLASFDSVSRLPRYRKFVSKAEGSNEPLCIARVREKETRNTKNRVESTLEKLNC